MLHKMLDLEKFKVTTVDAPAEETLSGTVHDFFFDDHHWMVRYVVVDTGGWLDGRRVLVSPVAISRTLWPEYRLALDLTREQIEHSPDVEADRPVSRQEEVRLAEFYSWPIYWGLPLMQPPHPPGVEPRGGEERVAIEGAAVEGAAVEGAAVEGAAGAGKPILPGGETTGAGQLPGVSGADPALRSFREVRDYAIHAVDGEIGRLHDLIVDDDGWLIRWLVIDTGHWLPGRHVIVAPDWIQEISWKDSEVVVSLSQNQIEHSPEFDLDTVPDRRYESELREHYGRDRAAPGSTVED